MSLRFRLNLLFTLVFVAILLIGSALVIQNARKALAEETQATAQLTLQLLELAFFQTNPENQLAHQSKLMWQIKEFGKTHQLHIEVIHGEGLNPFPTELEYKSDAPEWFVKLVEPTSMILRQSILVPGMPSSELVIRPNPADEITEAWEEARSFLGVLLFFFLIANILLFIIIGRLFKPINAIIKGLDDIEQGDYQSRLQAVKLPELHKITQKFNRMAGILEQSRDQNRYLKQRSLAIQEDERRHLARELHDEMGQSVSAIKAVAASIGQQSSDQKTKSSVTTIMDISTRIYNVVRGMMKRLHPVILDELGLIAALNDVTDNWNTYHENTFCHFKTGSDLDDLSQDVSITIYRIVQECLNNVAKHSQATDVYINLYKENSNALKLSIEDNGIGFDITRATPGLGLPGMQERVEALNGEFKIKSDLSRGVEIQVTLPLKKLENQT
ncbi:MAG: ATP-binding protein [Gammaproteobacteria bacterium]